MYKHFGNALQRGFFAYKFEGKIDFDGCIDNHRSKCSYWCHKLSNIQLFLDNDDLENAVSSLDESIPAKHSRMLLQKFLKLTNLYVR